MFCCKNGSSHHAHTYLMRNNSNWKCFPITPLASLSGSETFSTPTVCKYTIQSEKNCVDSPGSLVRGIGMNLKVVQLAKREVWGLYSHLGSNWQSPLMRVRGEAPLKLALFQKWDSKLYSKLMALYFTKVLLKKILKLKRGGCRTGRSGSEGLGLGYSSSLSLCFARNHHFASSLGFWWGPHCATKNRHELIIPQYKLQVTFVV